MAALRTDLRWAALGCAAFLGMSTGAAAAQLRPGELIDIDGEDLRIDYQRNTLQLRKIVMKNSDGTMLIRAQEAKAHSVEMSTKDSQWEFSGDVHIEVNGAILDSATATVTFKANGLDSAHAVGTPAQFSHMLKGATQRSQGRARTIDYDADKAQLHLSGGVFYSDGRNDINTSMLNYNMADRSIDSSPGAGERVRLHLQLGSAPAGAPPAANPAAPSGAAAPGKK
ncbi:MAG: LptA/OstA family protein [Pseudomonadota bacterium]